MAEDREIGNINPGVEIKSSDDLKVGDYLIFIKPGMLFGKPPEFKKGPNEPILYQVSRVKKGGRINLTRPEKNINQGKINEGGTSIYLDAGNVVFPIYQYRHDEINLSSQGKELHRGDRLLIRIGERERVSYFVDGIFVEHLNFLDVKETKAIVTSASNQRAFVFVNQENVFLNKVSIKT